MCVLILHMKSACAPTLFCIERSINCPVRFVYMASHFQPTLFVSYFISILLPQGLDHITALEDELKPLNESMENKKKKLYFPNSAITIGQVSRWTLYRGDCTILCCVELYHAALTYVAQTNIDDSCFIPSAKMITHYFTVRHFSLIARTCHSLIGRHIRRLRRPVARDGLRLLQRWRHPCLLPPWRSGYHTYHFVRRQIRYSFLRLLVFSIWGAYDCLLVIWCQCQHHHSHWLSSCISPTPKRTHPCMLLLIHAPHEKKYTYTTYNRSNTHS